MNDAAIYNVLKFIRSIRDGVGTRFNDNVSMSDILVALWGFQSTSGPFLRALATTQENVEDCINLVSTDQRIDGEGRDGVLTILGRVQQSLSPVSLSTNFRSYYQDISIVVSQVSLVAGLYNANSSPYLAASGEIDSLIEDLTAELERVNDEEFSDVREFARKQIQAIIGMLRNVDVFGTDAAYEAYFQLVLSTRRAREGQKEAGRGVAERLWPAIERWAGRLAIIEAAVTHSETLLVAGGKVIQLLGGPDSG